ncbi:phage protein NinX family protein [Pseudomonas palmensis]|uniref:phage protein NinX family protein n=1 Tax=Pseudomonas palmensis TaxID=2815362 RepID=UPI001AE378A7|nr:phage protein NinX family protein [Pseudomonas palmensis]
MTDLIEVKTADLVGEQLAWAVAEAEGLDVHVAKPHYGTPARVFVQYRGESTERCERYDPHESWALGGRLIQQHQVNLHAPQTSDDCWAAWVTIRGKDFCHGGWQPLAAACRAIVATKFGDTVQVPKELTP